jgi:hypothetical protein
VAVYVEAWQGKEEKALTYLEGIVSQATDAPTGIASERMGLKAGYDVV